jgi:dienelactone hydrolase
VPDAYNTAFTMEAYGDVRASGKGPFPVVLFSHGVGAYRMASSALTTGIASWGYVVVSADYTERGVVTQLPGQQPASLDPARDRRVMLASLDLAIDESKRTGSMLHGALDPNRVGAIGHSAGATTAFDALADSHIEVAVGWAPAAPSTTVTSDKPTMVVGAGDDLAVTPTAVDATYRSLPAPTRKVVIEGGGHNSFTDLCVVTRDGGGMVTMAVEQHLVPDALAKVLLNGCEPNALAPERFWPVAQHFTVPELRLALGEDVPPAALSTDAARAFPGLTVTYGERR